MLLTTSVIVDRDDIVKYCSLMSQSPTERFHLAPAPDGLQVVQNLLNTRAIDVYGLPDLIADGEAASTTWEMPLSDDDATALRTLRANVEAALAGELPPIPVVSVELIPDTDGIVRLSPTGSGAQYIASEIWSKCFSHKGRHVASTQAMQERVVRICLLRPLPQQQWRLARRQDLRQRCQSPGFAGAEKSEGLTQHVSQSRHHRIDRELRFRVDRQRLSAFEDRLDALQQCLGRDGFRHPLDLLGHVGVRCRRGRSVRAGECISIQADEIHQCPIQ